jgi:hypothetical protein
MSDPSPEPATYEPPAIIERTSIDLPLIGALSGFCAMFRTKLRRD